MKASVRDFASISVANKTQDKAVFVSGEFLSLSLSHAFIKYQTLFYAQKFSFLKSLPKNTLNLPLSKIYHLLYQKDISYLALCKESNARIFV